MRRIDLLKKLLPGFIPLFIFIAADEIWGTRTGLVVALVIGLAEMLYIYVREKRLDKFVIIDTALLMVLGGISIILDNDIFFKLKPFIIEAVMCIILGVSAFSKFDIMGGMTQRYMKGIEMNEEVKHQFKRSLVSLFWIFTAYSLLVLYSTFFMSKGAWAFISGGLFYIIFVIYFIVEIIAQRLKKKSAVQPATEPYNPQQYEDEEWLPLVEPDGRVVGKALRSVCHGGSRLLHPVVHLHVLTPQKMLYLQKRPETKLIQPGKWDTAVGGHISFGEDVQTALKREAYEEIGLQDFSARSIGYYLFESEIERELVYSFISYDYKKIHLHSDEVKEGKFWTHKQIEDNLGKGVFTPNFELEYKTRLREQLFGIKS